MPDFRIKIPSDLTPEAGKLLTNPSVDINESGDIDHAVELAFALKTSTKALGLYSGQNAEPPNSLVLFRQSIINRIKTNLTDAYSRFDSLLDCEDKSYEELLTEISNYIRANKVRVLGIGEFHGIHPDNLYVQMLKKLHGEFGIEHVFEEGVPFDPSAGIATDDRDSPHYRFLVDRNIPTTALPIGQELLDANTLADPFLRKIDTSENKKLVIGYLGICHLIDEQSRRRHNMTIATFNRSGYGIAGDDVSMIYGENIPVYDYPSLMDEMREKDIPVLGVGFSSLRADADELMNQQDALFLKPNGLPADKYMELLKTTVDRQKKLYETTGRLPIVGGYHIGIERENDDLFSIRYLDVKDREKYFSPDFLEALHYTLSRKEIREAFDRGNLAIRVLASRTFNDVGEIKIYAGGKTILIEVENATGKAFFVERGKRIPFKSKPETTSDK